MHAWTETQWDVGYAGIAPVPRPRDKEQLHVGIEVEMELKRPIRSSMPGMLWQKHNEGSLRGFGVELVLEEPTPLKTARVGLAQLSPYLETAKSTFRAAVHCHYDVRWTTPAQLASMYLLSVLFEPSLYRLVGHGRDESNFCAPAAHDMDRVRRMYLSVFEPEPNLYIELLRYHPKYSGVNLAPALRFGSVEYRHMQTPIRTHVYQSLAEIDEYVSIGASLMLLAADCPVNDRWIERLPGLMETVYTLLPIDKPDEQYVSEVVYSLARPRNPGVITIDEQYRAALGYMRRA